MKLITGIVATALMVGGAWAQNPSIIDKTRSTMNSVQEQKTNDSNAALEGVGQTGKPAPGAPATKPAPATAVKSPSAASKPTPAPAVKPAAKPAVAPAVKASSPASKPAPAVAPAAKAAVKPAPVPAVKSSSAPSKAAPVAAPAVKATVKPAIAPVVAPAVKPVADKAKATAANGSSSAKTQVPVAKPAGTVKPSQKIVAQESAPAAKQPGAKQVKPAVPATVKPTADASKKNDASKPKPEDKKWSMTGKRDPFFSPVVQQAGGSGCSTGKKCLEIGQINLRGVVKSDNGFIAVVTNNMNKAYFLRENDPVFNGYVVKITGDSVVFQETMQDKLGKPFTREIVKKIFTPAV